MTAEIEMTSLKFGKQNNQRLKVISESLIRNYPGCILKLQDILPIILQFLNEVFNENPQIFATLREVKMDAPAATRDVASYIISVEMRDLYSRILEDIQSIQIVKGREEWHLSWDFEKQYAHKFTTDQYIALILFLFKWVIEKASQESSKTILQNIMQQYRA